MIAIIFLFERLNPAKEVTPITEMRPHLYFHHSPVPAFILFINTCASEIHSLKLNVV